jgi:hypothetical protein
MEDVPMTKQAYCCLRRVSALSSALVLSAGTLFAQFSYPDFSSGSATLIFHRDATIVGNVLRLNPAQQYRYGAAYHREPQYLVEGFETSFAFRITDRWNGGADGLSFIIARQPIHIGCCLGYHGIPYSIAVEFDTWQNYEDSDPNDNHISINTRWEMPNSYNHAHSLALVSPSFALDSGETIPVRVVYRNGVISVYVRDLSSPLIQATVSPRDMQRIVDSCGRAYVGFTGGSGGAVEIHDILYWSFTPFRTENSGDIDINGCVDDADLLAVLFAFGNTGSNLGRVDVNCDGVVDDADLLQVLFNFGSGC